MLFKIGDKVRIKSKILENMKPFWGGTPEFDTFSGILEVKGITDSMVIFNYTSSGGSFNLLEDEVEFAALLNPNCSCSIQDLMNFGHKCGKKAPIDKLWIFKPAD